MKRFVWFLCLVLLSNGKVLAQNLNYEVVSEEQKTVRVVSNGSAYSGAVEVPETVMLNGNTYKVTEIGDYAFCYALNLTEIILPRSIERIGVGAFSGCTNLVSIALPEGLRTIGDEAFARCGGLREVSLPADLSEIGESAFENCGLTGITLPTGITAIEKNTFKGCWGIETIALPPNLKILGEGALLKTGLTTIDLPAGLTTIKKDALPGLERISIPASVTSLDGGFMANMGRIQEGTFEEIDRKINIAPENPAYIYEEGVIYSKDKTKLVTFIYAKELDKDGFYHTKEGVTTIGTRAFGGSVLRNSAYEFQEARLILSEGVTEIEEYAFENGYLNQLKMPRSIRRIGKNAFSFQVLPHGIILLSDVPPAIPDEGLGTPYAAVFYVPSRALERYQQSNWSREEYTIRPFLSVFYGSGTAEDPFLLYTADDLYTLSMLTNNHTEGGKQITPSGQYYEVCHYRLMLDIDFSGKGMWTPLCFYQGIFTGSIDGNGKRIIGLKSDKGGVINKMSKASVKDLHLQDCYIDTENATFDTEDTLWEYDLRAQLRYAGSIANSISGEGAFISGCTVQGGYLNGGTSREGMPIAIGGIVGCASGAQIDQCLYDGTVKCYNEYSQPEIGGIAGSCDESVNIIACEMHGEVKGSERCGYDAIGGIVGFISLGEGKVIRDCKNYASVGGVGGGLGGGGIAGNTRYSIGHIINCYNYGNVSGKFDAIGGIVGSHGDNGHYEIRPNRSERDGLKIDSCFNYGTVTSTLQESRLSAGGIIGEGDNYPGSAVIKNSYNAGDIHAYPNDYLHLGGIIGKGPELVENSGNTGNIYLHGTGGYTHIGGIQGDQSSYEVLPAIKNTFNAGNIYIENNSDDYIHVAGVAYFSGREEIATEVITNCYNTGNIYVAKAVPYLEIGGVFLTDNSNKYSILNCYSVGSIECKNANESKYLWDKAWGIGNIPVKSSLFLGPHINSISKTHKVTGFSDTAESNFYWDGLLLNSATTNTETDGSPLSTAAALTENKWKEQYFTNFDEAWEFPAGTDNDHLPVLKNGLPQNVTLPVHLRKPADKYLTLKVDNKQRREGKISFYQGTTLLPDSTTLKEGTVVTVKMVPENGFLPQTLYINGEAHTITTEEGGALEFTLNQDSEVTGFFKQAIHTVEIRTPEYGRLLVFRHLGDMLPTNTSLLHATKIEINAFPQEGYRLAKLLVNDEEINNHCTYRVESSVVIEAVFEPIQYHVRFQQPENGELVVISGTTRLSSGAAVQKGSTITITAEHKAHQRLKYLLFNGVEIENGSEVVIEDEVSEIIAVFDESEPEYYAVHLEQTEGGTVWLLGAYDLAAVPYGTELTAAITPDEGYILTALTANGVDILSSKRFTVTEATTVVPVFSKKTRTASVDAFRMKVYPNPARDYLVVEEAAANAKVILYSVSGAPLYSSITDVKGMARIDVTTFAEGTYVLQIGQTTYTVLIAR